jgi:hypothetical protein
VLEGLLALIESLKIGVAHYAAFLSSAVKKDAHEALGVRVGERLQKDAVHNGKDGGVGADSEREGENGNACEAGIFAERAQGVADVQEEILE